METPTRAGSAGVPVTAIRPRLALHHEVVGVLAGVGPVRAVAGDVDVDDVRPERAHGLLPQADAVGPARRVVLEEDVAPLDQPLDRGPARRVLDVERDAPLAAVHPDEAAREAGRDRVPRARDVAPVGPLDLDHLRPEVEQEPRGERPGEAVLEGEDAGAREERHPRTVNVLPRREVRVGSGVAAGRGDLQPVEIELPALTVHLAGLLRQVEMPQPDERALAFGRQRHLDAARSGRNPCSPAPASWPSQPKLKTTRLGASTSRNSPLPTIWSLISTR